MCLKTEYPYGRSILRFVGFEFLMCRTVRHALVRSRDMISAMGIAVDKSIKAILENGAVRARALSAREMSGSVVDDPFRGLHKMYTRVLACIMFPHTRGTAEEVEMWEADNYKMVREWVGRFGDKDNVTPAQHTAALQFLDSYDGKGSLMAGFLARYQLLNKNPFYDPAAFATPQMFENWKMNELASVEAQKQMLVKFNKTELHVEVFGVRAVDKPRVETLGQAVGDPLGAVMTANSKMFGMGKILLNKTMDTTKTYGSLFSKNPITATFRGTKELLTTSVDVTRMTLMSPATVTQALSRKRADIWCHVAFAAYEHTSQIVGDVTPEKAKVALETEVTWQVIYIYVHIYIYAHINIHIFIYIYIYIYIFIYIYMFIYIYIYIYMYIHVCVYIYTYIYMYMCAYAYM